MPLLPETMRLLIIVCIAGMALMAACYLRTRSLRPSQVLAWALLILAVPILGPFMVIASRPGAPQKRRA
jgi:hypothetical protein